MDSSSQETSSCPVLLCLSTSLASLLRDSVRSPPARGGDYTAQIYRVDENEILPLVKVEGMIFFFSWQNTPLISKRNYSILKKLEDIKQTNENEKGWARKGRKMHVVE